MSHTRYITYIVPYKKLSDGLASLSIEDNDANDYIASLGVREVNTVKVIRRTVYHSGVTNACHSEDIMTGKPSVEYNTVIISKLHDNNDGTAKITKKLTRYPHSKFTYPIDTINCDYFIDLQITSELRVVCQVSKYIETEDLRELCNIVQTTSAKVVTFCKWLSDIDDDAKFSVEHRLADNGWQ